MCLNTRRSCSRRAAEEALTLVWRHDANQRRKLREMQRNKRTRHCLKVWFHTDPTIRFARTTPSDSVVRPVRVSCIGKANFSSYWTLPAGHGMPLQLIDIRCYYTASSHRLYKPCNCEKASPTPQGILPDQ